MHIKTRLITSITTIMITVMAINSYPFKYSIIVALVESGYPPSKEFLTIFDTTISFLTILLSLLIPFLLMSFSRDMWGENSTSDNTMGDNDAPPSSLDHLKDKVITVVSKNTN